MVQNISNLFDDGQNKHLSKKRRLISHNNLIMSKHWAVNNFAMSILQILPTNSRFSAYALKPVWFNLSSYSCNYACLKSPNRDKTCCRLSWIPVMMALWLS